MNGRTRVALRAAAAVGALYLTVGLAVLVPWPGGRPLVGVARAAALVAAWGGAYAVARERLGAVELAALVLALSGYWQPVAWVVVLPAAGVLAVAAAVLARAARREGGGEEEDPDTDAGDDESPG